MESCVKDFELYRLADSGGSGDLRDLEDDLIPQR